MSASFYLNTTKQTESVIGCRFCVAVLLCCLLLVNSHAKAEGIEIREANSVLINGQYRLNAEIGYTFTEAVLEALKSGVAITLMLSVEIERTRSILWNEKISTILQHNVLQYHALSGTYLVKNKDTAKQQTYLTLNGALEDIGRVTELPLLPARQLKADEQYLVKMKSEIEIDALPAPLRPVAHISNDWNINSEWFVCDLRS